MSPQVQVLVVVLALTVGVGNAINVVKDAPKVENKAVMRREPDTPTAVSMNAVGGLAQVTAGIGPYTGMASGGAQGPCVLPTGDDCLSTMAFVECCNTETSTVTDASSAPVDPTSSPCYDWQNTIDQQWKDVICTCNDPVMSAHHNAIGCSGNLLQRGLLQQGDVTSSKAGCLDPSADLKCLCDFIPNPLSTQCAGAGAGAAKQACYNAFGCAHAEIAQVWKNANCGGVSGTTSGCSPPLLVEMNASMKARAKEDTSSKEDSDVKRQTDSERSASLDESLSGKRCAR